MRMVSAQFVYVPAGYVEIEYLPYSPLDEDVVQQEEDMTFEASEVNKNLFTQEESPKSSNRSILIYFICIIYGFFIGN